MKGILYPQKIKINISAICFALYILLHLTYLLNFFVLPIPLPFMGLFLVVVLFIWIIKNCVVLNKYYLTTDIKLFVLMLFTMFCNLFLQFIFLDNIVDKEGRYSITYNFSSFINILSYIFLGFFCSGIKIKKKTFFPVVIMLFILIIFYPYMDLFYLINYNLLPREGLNHLTLGITLNHVIFFCFSSVSVFFQIVVFLLTCFILYSTTGRSILILYVVSILSVFFLQLRKKYKILFLVFLGVLLVVSFPVIFTLYLNIKNVSEIRQMFFFLDLTSDTSFQARINQLEVGLSALPYQLFIGNPNYLIYNFNSLGAYIHNILSMWQFYGFIPFCVFLFLLTKYFFKYVFSSPTFIKQNLFSVVSIIYSCFSLMLTKNYEFDFAWFTLSYVLFSHARNRSDYSSFGYERKNICHQF